MASEHWKRLRELVGDPDEFHAYLFSLDWRREITPLYIEALEHVRTLTVTYDDETAVALLQLQIPVAEGCHVGPEDCPTYYDGCHCTGETVAHLLDLLKKCEEGDDGRG